MGERLAEAQAELQALREAFKTQTERLGESENVVRFYSDPRNYSLSKTDSTRVFQDCVKEDFSQADNDAKTYIAGNRARVYLKKYEK